MSQDNLDWSQFSQAFEAERSNPATISSLDGSVPEPSAKDEPSAHKKPSAVDINESNVGTEDRSALAQAFWEGCLEILSQEVAEKAYRMWLAPLSVCQDSHSDTHTLMLVAPSRFIATWVQSKYRNQIEALLDALSEGQFSAFTVRVESVHSVEANITQQDSVPPSERPLVDYNQSLAQSNRTSISQIDSTNESRSLVEALEPHQYRSAQSGLADPSLQKHQNIEKGLESTGLKEETRAFELDVLDSAAHSEKDHETDNGNIRTLSATNKSLVDVHKQDFLHDISEPSWESHGSILDTSTHAYASQKEGASSQWSEPSSSHHDFDHESSLDATLTFDNYVEGKSNQMAVAAGQQVAENPGTAYNPLFIYGGVGLGKTHLMHAIGNEIRKSKPNARVVYLNSERFVRDMVNALKLKATNEFKQYYRSVDALLIDDIQFFAKKEQSQEEFFHTFNALIEGGQQIILTCDRFPKEINGLEERLKSRFGWGLTQAIEPPELETRVAILKKKADLDKLRLDDESAFFIAQRIKSNVRELEGSLKRVAAFANFKRRPITVDLIREALHDLLSMQERLVTIENIQRTVADYYKIKLADLSSKRRTRSVARPRQVAMFLAKELTTRSLPEVGDAFGGRDHTTVLHACKKIRQLIESDSDIREDVKNLSRTLSS